MGKRAGRRDVKTLSEMCGAGRGMDGQKRGWEKERDFCNRDDELKDVEKWTMHWIQEKRRDRDNCDGLIVQYTLYLWPWSFLLTSVLPIVFPCVFVFSILINPIFTPAVTALTVNNYILWWRVLATTTTMLPCWVSNPRLSPPPPPPVPGANFHPWYHAFKFKLMFSCMRNSALLYFLLSSGTKIVW